MKTLLILTLVGLLAGCSTQREWYKEQGWTPDSFNYTLQRDRTDGAISDYWGLGWSLK